MELEPLPKAFGLLLMAGLPSATRQMRRNPLPAGGHLSWHEKACKESPLEKGKWNYLQEFYLGSNHSVLDVVFIGASCPLS